MESQPQNPEFRIILKTFTHANMGYDDNEGLFVHRNVLENCSMNLMAN